MLAAAARQFFVNHGIQPCRVVVAVSGGVDSTALLVALHELEDFELIAAHVNHHLRGEESDGDEAFVRDLCAKRNVELHVADGTLDPLAVKARGIEAAAREVRYARLQQIREATNARYIATAHQKNDQAETIAMGMRGIKPVREDGIIRPFLEVTRKEIEAWLREKDIEPRRDSSNDDPRFLRNRVRRGLADVKKPRPRIDHLRVEETDDETRFLDWPHDEPTRLALLRHHIRRLDPEARPRGNSSGSRNVELVRRGVFILRRKLEKTAPFEVPVVDGKATIGTTTIHIEPGYRSRGLKILLPDNPALTIRNRRPGDRFNSKKLKDFLIDRKIPAGVRDRILLLVCNGEIACIAGIAVAKRFQGPAGVPYDVWMEESGAADN